MTHERTAPNLEMPAGIYRLDSTDSVTRRINMKRSFRCSASPIAAVVVVAGFLATACSAGQGVASPTPASASLAPRPTTSARATASRSSASPSATSAGPMALHDGAPAAGTYTFQPFAGPDVLGLCASQPAC